MNPQVIVTGARMGAKIWRLASSGKEGYNFALKIEQLWLYGKGRACSSLREAGEPFSILMCDLDYFKKINDTYGHQAGDRVLREFGAFLRSGVRKTDKVIRYGGEEFVIVFPRCRAEEACMAAENLREAWKDREICLPSGKVVRSSYSGGVAEFGKNGL